MGDKILVQAIEDNGGGLYVAYIVNDVCTALFCGFEYVPESVMLRELENAYAHGVADWENPLQGDSEQRYNDLITGEAGSAHIIGQMDCEGFTDWPNRMGGNGEKWSDLKDWLMFRVVFADNRGRFAGQVLAESAGGTQCRSIEKFDGALDLAFIRVPAGNANHFRALADSENNVLLYDTV